MSRADTEPQPFEYRNDQYMLNRFDVFQRLNVIPADILLALKIDCIFNRKRPMGRDFFDAGYLDRKLGIVGRAELKHRLSSRCDELDFRQLAKDIEPFLFTREDTKKVLLFREFVESM